MFTSWTLLCQNVHQRKIITQSLKETVCEDDVLITKASLPAPCVFFFSVQWRDNQLYFNSSSSTLQLQRQSSVVDNVYQVYRAEDDGGVYESPPWCVRSRKPGGKNKKWSVGFWRDERWGDGLCSVTHSSVCEVLAGSSEWGLLMTSLLSSHRLTCSSTSFASF